MAQILIVDNDADLREALVETLVVEGYTVRVAADGQAAIRDLDSGDLPSLVLVDERMPNMRGRDFLDWLSGNRRFDAVVAVLASGDSGTLRHPRAAAVLRKPYGVEELLTVVRKLTGT